jgi:hypothetical protein
MVATLTLLPFIITGAIGGLAALDFLGLGLPPSYPSARRARAAGQEPAERALARLHGVLHLRADAVAAGLRVRGRARRLRPAKDLPVRPAAPPVAPRRPAGRARLGRAGAHGRGPVVGFVQGGKTHRGGARGVLRPAGRRDAGDRRRIGLGQVGHRALDGAAAARERRGHGVGALRRHRHARGRRAGAAAGAGQRHQLHLPGADDLAQPAAHGRAPARREPRAAPGAPGRRRGRASSSCSGRSASAIPRSGSGPTRTSSRAGSASG